MYAVVRIRGGVNTRPEIKDTLKMLRLNRVNHAVVLKEDPNFRGMIQVVKDYVAWGKLEEDTLSMLLEKRGRLSGNRRLTDQIVKEKTSYGSIKEFAKAVNEGKASLKDAGVKPVFRLHPPRKGVTTTKKTVQQGGVLGRHEAIGDLITKMR